MAELEKRNEYLDAVLSQVRWKAAHEAIERELSAHIEDQAEAYQKEGMTAQEAQIRAVEQMGDAIDVGTRLDASYRPRHTKTLIIQLAVLVLISVACRALVYESDTRGWVEYIASLAVGCGLFALLYNINAYKLVRYSGYVYGAAVLAVALSSIASRIWGITRLNSALIASLRYAPMLLAPLLAACVCGVRERGMGSLFLFGSSVALVAFGLIRIPASISVAELAAVSLFILIVASANGIFGKNRALPIVICSVAVTIAFLIVCVIHRYRVHALFNPQTAPLGIGWYGMSVREAVSGGQLLGSGADTARTISAGFSVGGWRSGNAAGEYLLTTIIQRYGFLPAALIAAALLGFMAVGAYRALRLKSLVGRVVGSSVILGFFVRTVNYIAVNLGLYSGAVLPLPFSPFDNASLIICFALAGLLLSLFRADGLAINSENDYKRLPRLRVRLEWEK